MGKREGEKPEHSTRKAVTPHQRAGGRITMEMRDVSEQIPRSMKERRQGPEHD